MQRLLLVAILFFSPAAFAYDWQTPLMWDWVLTTANPQLNEHESEITTLQSQLTTQAAQIASLQADLASAIAYIDDLQTYVNVDDVSDPGRPVITVSGANLQIVNGLGSTPTVNGVGNLIVGYDESMTGLCTIMVNAPLIDDAAGCTGGFWLSATPLKTGSHNVVVGAKHTYTSNSALVAGTANFSRAVGASITGGYYNYADANWASVTGGGLNIAAGYGSSVTGGSVNHVDAGATHGAVSGGTSNNIRIGGINASISGGSAGNLTGADDWQAGTLFEDD
jgi:hypothetical protein